MYVLANNQSQSLAEWNGASFQSGNIYVADLESNIDWTKLQPIGINTSGGGTSNDFSDVDSLLGMSGFSDSVSNVFTTDGNTPRGTDNFTLMNYLVNNIPIINSTDNTNFITGVLWDRSDDNNGQYDMTNREDLVFMTRVNKTAVGKYGTYDYEIKIPAKLRAYNTTNPNSVVFYAEIY